MNKHKIQIEGIPAILWGNSKPRGKLFIAVHGDMASKEDPVIAIIAEEAASKGYALLSFDLPEHGERKNEPRLCNP
jgi:predicted alpha/beta-hydrolase family hydrolase